MYLMEAIKETGKASRKSWLNDKYHVILNKERRAFQAKDSGEPYWIDMSFENFMADDWEPYKEPCKHSPMGRMYGIKEILDLPADHEMEFICKHCLVPLEPTGWSEIK